MTKRSSTPANIKIVTLRAETEWVETVEAGWNKLVGAGAEAIRLAYQTWFPERARQKLYGNGQAAQTICNILERALQR